MINVCRPLLRVRRVLSALLSVALGATLAADLSPRARAADAGQLQQEISSGQGQISQLSGAFGAAANRVAALDNSIGAIQGRIDGVQRDLDAKRAQLLRLRGALTAARQRLTSLEQFQSRAERVLSQQLLSAYRTDNPDMVTVVLEAKGFNELLERLSFAARVRGQSVRVVTAVRAARRAVTAQAIRLGGLEQRQQTLTSQVLSQRTALARDRAALVRRQLAAARDRSARASQLAGARGHLAQLQHQLSQLQAAQAAAPAAASGSGLTAPTGGASAQPSGAPSSGGGFTFPLPKSAASAPGSWSLDQGVDISAPGDTPEYAVCSGTVVLHGIGGFGPDAPVLHCDSPLGGGYSYVYYGHAGPANQLPVGTHVGAGQVMSTVGPGIVGISTGPHLEIGFADSSGTPVGGSASTMLSLLQGSY